jgi:hypothetical protein
VAYNINRENPFSVYGETLFIAVQCAIILLLFIAYADPKSGKKGIYMGTLVLVGLVFYAALYPAYFPRYVIDNAMVAQMILCNSHDMQLREQGFCRSTRSTG